MERVAVAEAAHRLGLSKDAVRQRIRRGTIGYEKDTEGRIFVLLSPETTQADGVHDDVDNAILYDYIEELKGRIRHLEGELERRGEEAARAQHIIAGLVQRVPAIEAPPDAPPEPRESPVSATEETSGTQTPPQEERPSWWQRLFWKYGD